MTLEEEKMKPIRRLWAAMLDSAIVDYRRAVLYRDDDREAYIRKEIDAMGYGEFCDLLQHGARRFRWKITEAAKAVPLGKVLRLDCPSCESKDSVFLYHRKKSYCALCTSCGLRYRIEKKI